MLPKQLQCVKQYPRSSKRNTAAPVDVSNSTVLRILKYQLHTKCVSKETATRFTDALSRPTQPMFFKKVTKTSFQEFCPQMKLISLGVELQTVKFPTQGQKRTLIQ